MTTYDSDFFQSIEAGSLRSGRAVVPLIIDLFRPASVIDVGCGLGAWLSVFRENGVTDVLGVDGYDVNVDQLGIPREQFRAHDLGSPLEVGRAFDLAISLEVAEHLPEQSAPVFVDSLVRVAPAIVFSAAIPRQGGTHHVNERWPEYWVRLFEPHGYRVVDYLRWEIWNDENVEWWYRQNMLIFATQELLDGHPLLRTKLAGTNPNLLSVVHPGCFRHFMGG